MWFSLIHAALTVTIGSIDEDATLHLGTAGGWGEEYTCPNLQEEGQLLQPEWKTQLDNFLDRFDIDHDLGGLAVARIWGLAAYRGLVAAAFTMHPGDMVEYSTTVEERITLVFSSATSERRRMDCISLGVPKFTKDQIREARENVLEFNLRLAAELQHNDQWFEKLVYAAAVCVLVEHRNTRLLTLACKALERLSALSGTDLSDEISKCRIQTNSTSVAAKSADKFGAPGADLFEKCDICDSGIEWYSSQEAQCAEGHMFGVSL
jgi:Putative zinc-finger of transcription factor IIIC complex